MADTLSIQDVYGTQPQGQTPTAPMPAVIPLDQIYVGGKAPVAPTQAATAPPTQFDSFVTNLTQGKTPYSDSTFNTGSVLRGMRDPIDAGAQLLSRGVEAVSPAGSPMEAWAKNQVQNVENINQAAEKDYEQNYKQPGEDGGARLAGSMLPMAPIAKALTAGGVLARPVAGAAIGATQGALTPVDTSQGDADYWAAKRNQVELGAATGAAFPAAGYIGGKLLSNPGAEAAQLAELARNQYGIPVHGAQITNSPVVKFTYSQLGKVPFSGVGNETAVQQSALNRAVSRTFGEDSAKITPEVLQQARTRIGGIFDGVARRTSIPMTDDLLGRLQGVVDNAKLSLSADSVAPVQNQAMNIVNTAANNGGNIGGKAYIDLTAKGGPLDTMMSSGDAGIRQAGIKLRAALDDALQTHAAPEDLAALKNARTQWKALKTVEPLTVRADNVGGATPSTGDISPAALRSAVNQSYDGAAMAKNGQIPLNDLARIGQRFLKEPPDSGTATRQLVTHGVGALGALTGAMAAHSELGIPLTTAAATVGGAGAAARLGASALRSNAYTNALINRGLGRLPASTPLARTLLPSVLASKIPLASMGAVPGQ